MEYITKSILTSGAQGVLWFIVWTMFIYETPAKHPRISLDEKDYIETALASAQHDDKVD